MKKTIKAHEEKEVKVKAKKLENAIPTYLLDREEINRSKILSNTIKQKRKRRKMVSSNSNRKANDRR